MEQGLTNSVAYENMFEQHTKSNVVMDVRDITKSLPLGRERIDILKGISFSMMVR